MTLYVIVMFNKNNPKAQTLASLGYKAGKPIYKSQSMALKDLEGIKTHDKVYLNQRNADLRLEKIEIDEEALPLLESLGLWLYDEEPMKAREWS